MKKAYPTGWGGGEEGSSQGGPPQQSRSEQAPNIHFHHFHPRQARASRIPHDPVPTVGANAQQALELGMTFKGTQNLPLAHLHLSFYTCFPPPGILLPWVPLICGKAFQKSLFLNFTHLFLAIPAACGRSQVRDWTCTTAATMPQLDPLTTRQPRSSCPPFLLISKKLLKSTTYKY